MYSLLSSSFRKYFVSPRAVFILSSMVVNGGNYIYNLAMGRVLGPAAFAEAGLIVTLLLVVSFIGMTFQLVSAKFMVELDQNVKDTFQKWISKSSVLTGIVITAVIIIFQNQFLTFFNISSHWVLIVFSMSIPWYFLMSARRGMLQGTEQYIQLSGSYQLEIWVKIATTFCLLFMFPNHVGTVVSGAIVLSVFSGNFGLKSISKKRDSVKFAPQLKRRIIIFFCYTMGYELIQILINYGDLLMVKHYFDNEIAGLYTSMALIGRMIYFVTWMLAMVLIPTVLNKKKNGEEYRSVMLRYFFIILCFSGTVILITFLFPTRSVQIIFGSAYTAIGPLLWKYALATTLFALSNLFIYYFISLDIFWPVFIAGILAIGQLILYILYHQNLQQIVHIQILGMGVLLFTQFFTFIFKSYISTSDKLI